MRDLLQSGNCNYPYLREVLQRLVKLPQFTVSTKDEEIQLKEVTESAVETRPVVPCASYKSNTNMLTIRIFSFSYKKGIPEDVSGNGGGYVFDCRSIHNPGRYDQYKQLTGLDQPVIDFLEKDGEIIEFLDSVYKLASTHVERYISRGFSDMMFTFECTGGQHRSVYSAQHLAEYIHTKYRVNVELCHREQNIMQSLALS